MTRKDYEALAVAIRRARIKTAELFNSDHIIDLVRDEVAHVLRLDNSRFDRERFEKACEE